MSTPPPATVDLRKLLARYDKEKRYDKDVKDLGPETEKIKYTLSDWIDTAGKHWCGNWTNRECHAGGRLGEKCYGHNCGSYMTTAYDGDPLGKAKYDEWFAKDSDCDLVQVFVEPVTEKEIYVKRKKWW